MKQIIFLLVLLGAFSCNKVTVGYLETSDAVYKPATITVKKTLDPVLDADRIRRQVNWVSTPIEGVNGTQPIVYKIISAKQGEVEAVQYFADVNVRGNGTIDIPYKNQIPAGTYKLTLSVHNEGYSATLNDIFTVVVMP